MSKAKIKKIGNIILNVLLYIFLAICIFAVFITVTAKRDIDGAAEIFGYQVRVVTSESMAECELTDVSEYDIKSIPIRSMVFVQVMPDALEDPDAANEWYRSLKEGDVLTFRYVVTTKQETITHRITNIEEKKTGGFIIELAGDNKTSEDGQLTQVIDTSIPNNTDYVIGKVVGQSYPLGFVMSYMDPYGIIIVIVVCAIIIMMEIVKIVKMLSGDRKKKAQEETAKKDEELEALRQKIAELEKQKSAETEEGKEDKEE